MAPNRYSVEELLQLKPTEVQPVDFDADEFKAIIEKVKQIQQLREEEFLAHGHFGRRRSSHHHHTRPKTHKPKVKTDDDGWSTFETVKKEAGATDGEEEKKESSPSLSADVIRIKPNNKNLGSSRAADNSDIARDKPTLNFNAFAALESEDEDE